MREVVVDGGGSNSLWTRQGRIQWVPELGFFQNPYLCTHTHAVSLSLPFVQPKIFARCVLRPGSDWSESCNRQSDTGKFPTNSIPHIILEKLKFMQRDMSIQGGGGEGG